MIERLFIHNYRCFENFSIDFTGRASTLIIGKSGTGKSTLRQALQLLQSICRGSSRVRDLIVGSDFSQNRQHIPMRFEIDLSLAGKRFRYTISFDMPENFREARIADESLSVDGHEVFSREHAQINLANGTTFRLDWHVAALPLIHERPGESSIPQVKAFFANMILVAPIPSNMSGFSEEDSLELNEDGGNISTCLNALLLRHPAAYGIISDYLQSAIPDFASIENVPRGEKGTQLIVKFEEMAASRSFSIDFKLLSDGEKCFFLSALIVASNKVNGPVFCMWDEPDNHLSLPEIGHFITRLRKIGNQRGQMIATSHHPETIRRFSDESTLVFTRKSHLEPTAVRILADFQYAGDLVEALVRDEVFG